MGMGLGIGFFGGPTLVLAWAFARLDSIIYALLPSKIAISVLLPSMLVGVFIFIRTIGHGAYWRTFYSNLIILISIAIWVLALLIGQLFKA